MKTGTPYDRPRGLFERLTWPMLREAWIQGRIDARRDDQLDLAAAWDAGMDAGTAYGMEDTPEPINPYVPPSMERFLS